MSVAVFGVLAAGVLRLVWEPLVTVSVAENRSRASMLAQEGLDAVRSIRNDAWTNLTDGSHGIDKSGGTWAFSGSSDLTDGFTRVIAVESVQRDGSNNMVESGGTTDVRSKKITATITWDSVFGAAKSLNYTTYVTNWNTYDWTETTDSDYGSGTLTDTIINETGEDAEIILESTASDGSWTKYIRGEETHTVDSDFTPGSTNNVVVTNDGLELDGGATSWNSVTSPTGSSINAVQALSASDAWAVTSASELLHYDGSDWSLEQDLGNTAINDLDMVSASEGWAVGDSGKFFYYDGTSWSEEDDLGNKAVLAIDMLSSSAGWAAGAKGTMYYYDGTSWEEHSDHGNADINSIHALSSSDVWAVGNGQIYYHYDGSSWSVDDEGGANLNGIDMVSATEGWVVSSSEIYYQYNGSAWSEQFDLGEQDMNAVDMLSSSAGWACGNQGTISYYDGSSWSLHTDLGSEVMNDISFASASEGWVVGASGSIYHYRGAADPSGTFESDIIDSGKSGSDWGSASWSETLPAGTDITVSFRSGDVAIPDGSWSDWSAEVSDPVGSDIPSPSSRYLQYRVTFTGDGVSTSRLDDITITWDDTLSADLYGIDSTATDDVWTVGSGGAIYHWDGDSWSEDVSPTSETLLAVSAVASGDIWAVGENGTVVHYDGSGWSLSTDLGGYTLYGLDMVSASEGWIVGSDGKIFSYNGSSWTEFADLGTWNLRDIDMLYADDGWLIAEEGGSNTRTYHWNGSNWSTYYDLGTDLAMFSIDIISATDVWLTGYGDRVYRWNGSAWSYDYDNGYDYSYGIDMASPTDGWIAADAGRMWRLENDVWESQESDTANTLRSVHIVSVDPYEVWIVGLSGTALHYSESSAGFVNGGTFVSGVFDADETARWDTLFFERTLPANTTATLSVRSGDVATPDPSWSDWCAEIAIDTGVEIPVSDSRYIQYRVTLGSTDGVDTPRLESVTVTYSQ